MLEELTRGVEQHVALLNAGVRSGDFEPFLGTFADAAVMRFEGVPAGPYVGREAIAVAYRSNPPDDTMQVTSMREFAGGVLVGFAWEHGGAGFFILETVDAMVSRLDVSFLSEADSAWLTGGDS